MTFAPALLLGAVIAVGVFHTLAPDHWLPIAVVALIAFGLWVVAAAWRDARSGERPSAERRRRGSATLLVVLGSSPMVEGLPVFFAAARFGAGLLATMAACFAFSTIATYVAVCVASHAALRRLSLGPLERYGEAISGAVIAVVGVAFIVWSSA